MINLKNITKIYNSEEKKVTAVKDVSISVKPGEIFGIIGFSGAGKSTLVRCINLLEKPTSGEVIIDGEDLMKLSETELRSRRQKISMIFQHFNLMKSRTVYENVAFPLKYRGLTKGQIEEKVKSLIKLVDLEDKMNMYPSQLSGGQKQRVAIARALAGEPKVLLCDEATSALDPQTTSSILKLLKDVNKKFNITIVVITHEMNVIKEICDSVAVMENGVVVEQGNVYDVFSSPSTPITRNFIDSTTNIRKIYSLIKENSDFTGVIGEDSKIVKLKYKKDSTSEPVISIISRKFEVNCSILYGNIDVLDDNPLGNLIVKIEGQGNAVDNALNYLYENKIEVEVIKDGRVS